jgi:hypothetical protein
MELIAKTFTGVRHLFFRTVYSSHVATKYQDWRGDEFRSHNQYLFVWLENGLIGLALFLAYIYAAIRQGASQQPYGPLPRVCWLRLPPPVCLIQL